MEHHAQRDPSPPGEFRNLPPAQVDVPCLSARIRRDCWPVFNPAPPPPYSGTGEAPSPAVESSYRDRPGREPYREEGPADREPIRFVREREPLRERPEREPGMSIRERLARDRAERDGSPTHHEGIPVNRDRDRDRIGRMRR